MKKIELSQGKFTLIDDEDYEFLVQWKWHSAKNYAVRHKKRVIKDGKEYREHIYIHRELLQCPKDMFIDHINGDKLDNRKDNLRIVDHRQNCQNKPARKKSRSGILGVSFCNTRNKWRSTIQVDGKYNNLGYYNSKEEAAIARDKYIDDNNLMYFKKYRDSK